MRSCFCFSPSSMLWPTLTMAASRWAAPCTFWGPWVFYRLGKAYALHTGSCSGFCQLLAAPSLGMWLHGLLNWLARLRWQGRGAPGANRCGLLAGEPVSVTCTGMLLTAAAALALGRLCSPGKAAGKWAAFLCLGSCLAESAYFANRTLPLLCAPAPGRTGLEMASAPHRRTQAPPVCRSPLCPPLPDPGPPGNLWGLRSWLLSLPLTRRLLNPGGGAVPAGNLERLLPGRPVAPLSPGWEPAHPGVALHLVPQPVAGPLLPRGSPSFPAVFRLYPAGASAQPCLFPHHEGSPVGAVPKCSGKSPSSSSAKRHGGACDRGQCLRLSHGPPLPGGPSGANVSVP